MSSSRPASIRDSKSPQVPPNARSPRSPLLPHFDDPPAPPDDPPDHDPPYEPEADDDNDIPYPEPGSEQTLLPPPNFNPFFTLVEDATSGEHYHPYVHYVFADDDPVIVTAAAMRSLGLDDAQYLPDNAPDGEERLLSDDGHHEEHQDNQVESPLPPPIPGVKERYLLIDIAADGHTIVDAKAMSADWQVTDAHVRAVPSFDEASPEHGYMLRIEGVEAPAKKKGKAKGEPGETKLNEAREKTQGDVFAALDGLVKGVESGLEVAGKIVGGKGNVRESERTVLDTTPGTTIVAGQSEQSKEKDGQTCEY